MRFNLVFGGIWTSPSHPSTVVACPPNAALALRCLVAIDLIGKWSMVDVLFVGLLVTTLKLDIKCALWAPLAF